MAGGLREADERGAILLIALFFAVFMVGMVYYVIGVAEAVLLSERMQDAVDASALSGAVMNARGMNFIVLINLVMSALLAILVALKLVETLAMVGIALASALAYPTFGLTLPLIPVLETVRSTASSWYHTLKPDIEQALEGLNTLSTTVARMAPPASKELAEEGVEKYWSPPVECATVAPARLTEGLPVEDDEYPVLCEKAGNNVGALIALPFSVIDVPELADAISGAVGGAAREFSDWFCGADGSGGSGGAPSIATTVQHYYPKLPSVTECENTKNDRVCRDSNAETADADPDDTTGRCQAGHDCSIDGPYERSVRAAREECDPTKRPAPVEYWWQEQTGTVNWTWNEVAWERGDETVDEPVQQHLNRKDNPLFFKPPCGPSAVLPMIVGYERDPHPNGDVNEINPVCSEGGAAPPLPLPGTRKGTVVAVPFKRVTHILGCRIDVREEKRGADEGPAASGSGRSSKRIIDGVSLGSEPFQVRVFATRKPGMVGPGRGVRVALWGAAAPDSGLGELENFGRYAVGQAEYFYDGTEGKNGWMWNMKWRGRLKRFRLPEDSIDAATLVGPCAVDDPGSPAFFAMIAGVKDLVMH